MPREILSEVSSAPCEPERSRENRPLNRLWLNTLRNPGTFRRGLPPSGVSIGRAVLDSIIMYESAATISESADAKSESAAAKSDSDTFSYSTPSEVENLSSTSLDCDIWLSLRPEELPCNDVSSSLSASLIAHCLWAAVLRAQSSSKAKPTRNMNSSSVGENMSKFWLTMRYSKTSSMIFTKYLRCFSLGALAEPGILLSESRLIRPGSCAFSKLWTPISMNQVSRGSQTR
mmetsp:Transcript_56190/g.100759  ORF Transcript_56190/g.100759 Transcript_56190/m.100759 type:complete len:231 (+) Transcript_56190:1444-2136(+)